MLLPRNAWRLGCFKDEDTPDYLIMRRNEDRFRDFQKQNPERLSTRFYITVVPNTLDLLECCLALLPRNLSVTLILNGLAQWEQEFIDREYPNIPKFILTTHRGCIPHDKILDMLTECNDNNFGIIDQDCFIIDSNIFDVMEVAENEIAESAFCSLNRKANLRFPRTYFLLFNTLAIRNIRKQYEISFKPCWTIPTQLEPPLAALKLGYDNFPHDSLNYFDTFQLIWAMAFHQGFSFRALSMPGADEAGIFHIGAGAGYLTEDLRDKMIRDQSKYEFLSKLDKEKVRAAAFSYYAHSLLLENTKNSELKHHYGPFFSPLGGSSKILEIFGSVISPQKVKEINLVIDFSKARS